MSDLPARRTDFVVASDGAVVPYTPPEPPAPPPRLLSRDERTDAYRAGLREAAEILARHGFEYLYSCEHSYQLRYRGLLLDFRVQRPGQVAYITSRYVPGHYGTKGKHGGTIYKLSDEIQSEFALMITASSRITLPPVFVALDENLPDPASHIVQAVLGLLKGLQQENKLPNSYGQLPGPAKELPDWI